MSMTPAELRALADRIESEECTGIAAGWCPVHGSCTCPKNAEGYRVIDHLLDSGCALHGAASNHAAAITQECHQSMPDAEVSSPKDKAPTGGLTSWDF